MRRLILLVLSFAMVIAIAGVQFSQEAQAAPIDKVYWTDSGTDKIQRADLDGSNVEDLVTGFAFPAGLAVDPAGGKMYWNDTFDLPGTGQIRRANLDGSGVELLVSGLDTPVGITLDVEGGKIYWTDTASQKIQRSNLDGTNVEDLVTGVKPVGIALDVAAGKIYWADITFPIDSIKRSNLDGSGQETVLLLFTPGSVRGIALDIPNGKIYLAERLNNRIRRANLDGSELEVLISGLDQPVGIELDLARGKMYWTSIGGGKVKRANLDGSGLEDVVSGLTDPIDLALDVPPFVPSHCTLNMALSHSEGSLDMSFEIGTPEPAVWHMWLIFQAQFIPLWSIPLPVVNPDIPVDFSIPFPDLGKVGFITTLTTSEGITCADLELVDTGPSSIDTSVRDLRKIFKESQPSLQGINR